MELASRFHTHAKHKQDEELFKKAHYGFPKLHHLRSNLVHGHVDKKRGCLKTHPLYSYLLV